MPDSPIKFEEWVGQAAEQNKNAKSARSVIYAIFRLIACILTFHDKKYRILMFRDKKYRILTFCDKTESYLTVLQQNNVEALMCVQPLWLSLARCPALSGSF